MDSELNQNEYGPSPKYILPLGNNYNPPVNLVETVPVANPNVIYTPPPNVITGYPQPNPLVPPTDPYQQRNQITPQVPTYPSNHMDAPPPVYPQPTPADPYNNSSDFQAQ